MAQQINLYNPAFRRNRDWLTATPLAAATGVMLMVMFALGAWAGIAADRSERVAAQRAETLKAAQDKLTSMSKEIAGRKSDAKLAADLATAQALLKGREQVMALLAAGGNIGNTTGFSVYLRGLARQLPKDLWLTGLSIGSGGNELEIRGRMLNAATLPEYIRRLNAEPAFQGRSFSALTILRPEGEKKNVAAKSGSAPAYVEFVLTPANGEASALGQPSSRP